MAFCTVSKYILGNAKIDLSTIKRLMLLFNAKFRHLYIIGAILRNCHNKML